VHNFSEKQEEKSRSSIQNSFIKKKQFLREKLKGKLKKPYNPGEEPQPITEKEIDHLFNKFDKNIDLVLKYYFYACTSKTKYFASFLFAALEDKYTIPDDLVDRIKQKIRDLSG